MTTTRRHFLALAGGAGASLLAARTMRAQANSPFRIAVITDEISDDFDHACSVAANEFGMHWVELRTLWKINVADLKPDDITRARGILEKYKLRVTDIGSPLFKVDWPGAPRSKFSAKNDSFNAKETFAKQDQVLASCIELAKQLKTDRIRCFDFWRIEDPSPYRAAIDDTLHKAAATCQEQGLDLVIENEHECNTATARDAVRTLGAVKNLNLNWDPANAVMAGELDAFPAGFRLLPKDRIHHCHVKNVQRNPAGKLVWAPVGEGILDWTAQFRALKAMGYRRAVSLETHWRGAGSPEASSRQSWAGMKAALAAAGAL